MAIQKASFLKIVLSIVLVFQFFACKKKQHTYFLAASSMSTSYYKVSDNIATFLQDEKGINIEVLSDSLHFGDESMKLNAINNCFLLSKGLVDFAISQNDVSIPKKFQQLGVNKYSNLRSVIPLYPEILFIFYKGHKKPGSIRELVKGKKVAMGPRDSGTARLTLTLFQHFGVDTTEFHPRFVSFEKNVLSDTIDVCCMVTGFSNPRIQSSLEKGGRIFSLGNPDMSGYGSPVDGFCLKYPLAKSYIIPQNIYSDFPKEAVLSVSIDAVLLTREDVDNELVYGIVETVLNHKQYLVMDMDNKVLSQITEQFDPLKLRFPLHKGAKHYLERNKPSFYERYAELFGVIFSIILAFIGAGTSIAKWNRLRRKNRIDTYYQGVMEYQLQISELDTADECHSAIQELKYLRQNAFEHLIHEKLSADDSFRIFITFVNDTIKEIEQHIEIVGKIKPGLV